MVRRGRAESTHSGPLGERPRRLGRQPRRYGRMGWVSVAKVRVIRPGLAEIEEDLIDNEQGTAFDRQSILFTAFNDGQVFNYDRGSIDAINEMLDRDGKAA